MHGKKNESKFTIQFNQTDPTHLQVTDILNKQERQVKARYIVKAVTHFLSCDGVQRPGGIDEKYIEAVVNRILLDWLESGAGSLPISVPTSSVDDSSPINTDHANDIVYSDAVEALGEDGLSAVAGALEMFRRKLLETDCYT